MLIRSSTYFPPPTEEKGQTATSTLFICFYKAYAAFREQCNPRTELKRNNSVSLAIYIIHFCSKVHHCTDKITKMSPYAGKKSACRWGAHRIQWDMGNRNKQVAKCCSYTKCREVSMSLCKSTVPCVKYPHQTVRSLAEKESESHHTGLALE